MSVLKILRGSFRPAESICRCRALTRQCANRVAERSRTINWIKLRREPSKIALDPGIYAANRMQLYEHTAKSASKKSTGYGGSFDGAADFCDLCGLSLVGKRSKVFRPFRPRISGADFRRRQGGGATGSACVWSSTLTWVAPAARMLFRSDINVIFNAFPLWTAPIYR